MSEVPAEAPVAAEAVVPEAAPVAAPVAAPEAANWVSAIEDPDLRGWAEGKHFQDATPADALNSHRNLEKMFGAHQAGNTVVLPNSSSTDEDRDAFFTKLGRPKEAGGYGFEIQEGSDPGFVDWAKGAFHKAGLSEAQAAGVVGNWNEYVAAADEASVEKYNTDLAADDAALRTEWGAAYDLNMSLAKRGAKQLGFTEGEIDTLEKTVGFKSVMERFMAGGKAMGEDTLETGQAAGGLMTPAGALTALKTLSSDPQWFKDWTDPNSPGHAAAVERKAQLSRMAAGSV